MGQAAKRTRENRTITVDLRDGATYFQLLGDGKAFVELVMAFLLSLGFQLTQGELSRRRVPDASLALPPGPAGWSHHLACPVHHVQNRQMRLDVARAALLATHGGLSLELCAALYDISPMALYCLICVLGHQSLGAVLTRCKLPLPVYFLADEKHSHCLTDKVYLPTIVSGGVLWHLGYTTEASAAVFTQSYQAFQRAASQQQPSYFCVELGGDLRQTEALLAQRLHAGDGGTWIIGPQERRRGRRRGCHGFERP